MTDFNDIGISRQMDWPRVAHLFRIGLFGAVLTFIGDMLLGWGVEDKTLSGLSRMLSAYTDMTVFLLPRFCMTATVSAIPKVHYLWRCCGPAVSRAGFMALPLIRSCRRVP